MSQLSESLISFKKKIEEAVVLVPQMIAEEKLKAVQFWNIVSERLQEIVNNSAADINALAMRLEYEEQQKQQSLQQRRDQISQQSQSVETNTQSSDDRQQLYLPIISSNCSQNNSNNNSNEMSEQLSSSVITTYHESIESHSNQQTPQLLIEKTQQLLETLSPQELDYSINSREKDMNSMTAKSVIQVIQEVEPNIITSQRRRNVIQSTQRALEVINDCINNNQNNNSSHLSSDNTSDQVIDEVIDENIIKIIENNDKIEDESNGNNSFNETSFDLSYESCEEKEIKTNEIIESNNNSKLNTKSINKKKGFKNKLNNNKKCCFECDVCKKLLPNNSALITHKWVHSKPYSCSECEARFSTKGNLLVHQRRHTGEKPFACDVCPASFSTKGNLKRHIKAHSGERPWKCSQCDSRFTEKKSLKVHMRRHTGEKPYQCSVCLKCFSQTGVLQTHMALHLDERKHLCELCGKAFRQRSQLRLHVLRHEGVKRWDCSDCSAKFLTKGDLERHHRVHTGERPFVCDLCGKTFTRQQSLNEHSNRHYGLKPYSCTVCSKTFAEMSACYKHIKVHKKQQSLDVKNDDIIKSSAKHSNQSLNGQELKTTKSKSNYSLQTSRSHINVIQSTTSSINKGLIYLKQLCHKSEQIVNNSDINETIDESVISSNSNTNNTTDNNTQFVDFTAINLLANTSTDLQNY